MHCFIRYIIGYAYCVAGRLLDSEFNVSLVMETFPPEVNGVSFTLARSLSQLGCNIEVICPKRDLVGKQDQYWIELSIPSKIIPRYTELKWLSRTAPK